MIRTIAEIVGGLLIVAYVAAAISDMFSGL